MYHLYEVVFENQSMWLKVQTSGDPERDMPAYPMLQARFGGTTIDRYEPSFSLPFRLSERTEHIFNWDEIKDSLPTGWDDHEFRLVEGPYAWCDTGAKPDPSVAGEEWPYAWSNTLPDGCSCHASKGRLDATCCSDFGLLEETDRRASRSQNAWHLNYIRDLEKSIANRDQTRRRENDRRAPAPPLQEVGASVSRHIESPAMDEIATAPAAAVNRVNRLAAQRYYCQIEGRYHPCSEQVKLKLMADAVGLADQLGRLPQETRQDVTASVDAILARWREQHQSNECAEKVVRGQPEIPEILYKYIPKDRIGAGAPDSLRATQLRALNDDMECNITTMNTDDQMNTLQFLALVQSKIGEHLGITPEWEDLLMRSLRYGDLQLSTFIQNYLTPHVGVVSFSTDPLVPTMWAHYARNTGIVVGYDTEALRNLGFALRPMLYSEMAPSYRPASDNTIQLSFFDRQRLQEQIRQGETPNSFSVVATANLAEMGAGWKSLSQLLFVKGTSWSYEKEMRLLVDLDNTRDTGKKDENCWPVKVIDVPPEAIREIHRRDNTQDADVARAVEAARGDNKKGLLVQRVSAHAFRIQRTVGSRY